MRHLNHRHTLGVKKEHRAALVAALATALFTHGRIRTTLSKARALRPFAPPPSVQPLWRLSPPA